jgi:hypothetical protein
VARYAYPLLWWSGNHVFLPGCYYSFPTTTRLHSQLRLGCIPKCIQLLLSLGLTAITAVVWEFLEYSSDVALGTKMNLGVSDTLSDLFFGLLGGIVMLAVAANSICFAQSFLRATNEA